MTAVDRLVALKGTFGREAEPDVVRLLERLSHARIRDAETLIRLHETVLFLRAYPHSARVLRLADRILFGFAERLRGVDAAPFEAAEVSGIAGSAISTNYSHSFARLLASRHAGTLTIDWENYAHPDRLGPVLAKLAPAAAEDWAVEPHIDWQGWFSALRGNLRWLIDNLEPHTYDALELLLLWEIPNTASRSETRLPGPATFFHKQPLIRRRDVSLAAELAGPDIATRRLTRAQAKRVMDVTVDTSAVRYRELWGFGYPDLDHVYRADFGRGVDLYWLGIAPEARLPLRAYHGGIFFKNGVPMGYVETLSLFERMEVGFNVYYTFRDGEAAWLYARFLKFCRQMCGVTCFSIDPYQLGDQNSEALEAGAFWFYRKLGFASASEQVQRLVGAEEAKLAREPDYRTPARTLRRLAKAPLLYGEGRTDWARFSLRALAQKLGRGPAWAGIVQEAGGEVSASAIERAKKAPEETGYLKLLQGSPQLRRGVLRMGQIRY